MDNINFTNIKDIKLGSRNLSIEAIILHISKHVTKSGTIHRLVLSDPSGKINCALFDINAKHFKEGDIIMMTKVFAKDFQTRLTLYKSCDGQLYKTGNFIMVFNEENNMSAPRNIETSTNNEHIPRDENNNNTSSMVNCSITKEEYNKFIKPDHLGPNVTRIIPIKADKIRKHFMQNPKSTPNICWPPNTSIPPPPLQQHHQQENHARPSIKQRLGPKLNNDNKVFMNQKILQLKRKIFTGNSLSNNSLFRKSFSQFKMKSKRFS
ncbi:hypothetical protein PVAND_001205 [Polypedilum vanderplanki]|uniref:OB domain-containing protein n=1 Tax=Polypedilum vanderplanki TaxID=319348 RepID=A0A9J6BMI0_POLVA|nr:hypothetical protein PVAND_001205 [Polypedilum vanderplanki]